VASHKHILDHADAKLAYDILAPEYYSDTHVTSRNFDAATREALSVRPYLDLSSLVIEFGAGRGRAGEYLGIDPSLVIQTDISEAMLQIQPRELCLLRVICDARQTPFLDQTFSTALALLFDHYNEQAFFKELYRVLQPGGTFIGTLPSYAWGTALRRSLGIPVNETRFINLNGEVVMAPSILSSDEEIDLRLRKAGFAEVYVRDLCLPENVGSVSPDIVRAAQSAGVGVDRLPILQVVEGRKPT
jgi:SAM-dependent methyltransferase